MASIFQEANQIPGHKSVVPLLSPHWKVILKSCASWTPMSRICYKLNSTVGRRKNKTKQKKDQLCRCLYCCIVSTPPQKWMQQSKKQNERVRVVATGGKGPFFSKNSGMEMKLGQGFLHGDHCFVVDLFKSHFCPLPFSPPSRHFHCWDFQWGMWLWTYCWADSTYSTPNTTKHTLLSNSLQLVWATYRIDHRSLVGAGELGTIIVWCFIFIFRSLSVFPHYRDGCLQIHCKT